MNMPTIIVQLTDKKDDTIGIEFDRTIHHETLERGVTRKTNSYHLLRIYFTEHYYIS